MAQFFLAIAKDYCNENMQIVCVGGFGILIQSIKGH